MNPPDNAPDCASCKNKSVSIRLLEQDKESLTRRLKQYEGMEEWFKNAISEMAGDAMYISGFAKGADAQGLADSIERIRRVHQEIFLKVDNP